MPQCKWPARPVGGSSETGCLFLLQPASCGRGSCVAAVDLQTMCDAILPVWRCRRCLGDRWSLWGQEKAAGRHRACAAPVVATCNSRGKWQIGKIMLPTPVQIYCSAGLRSLTSICLSCPWARPPARRCCQEVRGDTDRANHSTLAASVAGWATWLTVSWAAVSCNLEKRHKDETKSELTVVCGTG